MKIGYPCINNRIGCTANQTFRLANFSPENLFTKVESNLECLRKILEFNLQNNLMFFRIGSPLVPFASHEVCLKNKKTNWQERFADDFVEMGKFIEKYDFRISMHPDQFCLINSPNKEIVKRSVAELNYHAEVMDLMKLPLSAKIQIHVGGVYGDKAGAIDRFVCNYKKLPRNIKRRLVIENDHRLYSLKDCLGVYKKTGAPILFDVFHHYCLNNGEKWQTAMRQASKTWKKQDGALMMDYSNQAPGQKIGNHSQHIDIANFRKFIENAPKIDFDVMLEIKDKEKSALEAIKFIK
jgi:UV DNA damage endonuclease